MKGLDVPRSYIGTFRGSAFRRGLKEGETAKIGALEGDVVKSTRSENFSVKYCLKLFISSNIKIDLSGGNYLFCNTFNEYFKVIILQVYIDYL